MVSMVGVFFAQLRRRGCDSSGIEVLVEKDEKSEIEGL